MSSLLYIHNPFFYNLSRKAEKLFRGETIFIPSATNAVSPAYHSKLHHTINKHHEQWYYYKHCLPLRLMFKKQFLFKSIFTAEMHLLCQWDEEIQWTSQIESHKCTMHTHPHESQSLKIQGGSTDVHYQEKIILFRFTRFLSTSLQSLEAFCRRWYHKLDLTVWSNKYFHMREEWGHACACKWECVKRRVG